MNIKNSPTGQIISLQSGYEAFLPNPLPPQLNWSIELINTLSQADQVIGKLAGESAHLPNPHVLMRPFITREAVMSSKIEGTQATIGEILANSAGLSAARSPDDLQEVNNYIAALDYGIKRLAELPLSLRLIKEIHQHLMQGVRGAHATPGEFRRTQNWIGIPGGALASAKYVPPSPNHLMDCLGAFELFLHNRKLPILIHIALCHYQFEAIHPFLDGNGRIGRLLIILLLIERTVLPAPLLYLSAFFEATRDEYYRQLYQVTANGSWEKWLIYFLSGVSLQATDALSRAQRINELTSNWLQQVADIASSLPSAIIHRLVENPYLTTRKVAEHFSVAFTTAQRAIHKLSTLQIIEVTNDAKRDKVYCATKMLAILEEPVNLYTPAV